MTLMELFNLPVIIHALIGFYFAFFGFWNLYHWVPIVEVMTKKGIPLPFLLLPVGITWQIIAGCFIIAGIFVKLAALSLIPFTILAVFIFHPFWKFKGETCALNFSIFVANLTIGLAALLALLTPLNNLSDLLA